MHLGRSSSMTSLLVEPPYRCRKRTTASATAFMISSAPYLFRESLPPHPGKSKATSLVVLASGESRVPSQRWLESGNPCRKMTRSFELGVVFEARQCSCMPDSRCRNLCSLLGDTIESDQSPLLTILTQTSLRHNSQNSHQTPNSVERF